MDLPFHAVVLVTAAVSLVAVRRGAMPLAAAPVAIGLVASVAAFLLAEDPFHVLRHLAWTLFVYLPAGLVVAAFLLRRDQPKRSLLAVVVTALFVAVGLQAFIVEPEALVVTRYSIESEKVPVPLRIVVFSDLQTDEVGDYERLALAAGMAEEPDLVLFPGDYVQAPSGRREEEWAKLGQLLWKIPVTAPYGAFAVGGNVDAPGWTTLFDDTDVTPFARTERSGLESWLSVTGLSLKDSFDSRLSLPGSDRFDIVLGHGPDFALGSIDADLLVAGHTHGGQVRIPFFGPPLTLSRVPRSWASGMTELPSGGTLVVSRGIGVERGYAPRLRFLCRPEIVVIDVVPDGSVED